MLILLIKALLLIVPGLISEIRAGRLKAETQDEVMHALHAAHRRSVFRAMKAREAENDLEDDPNDRRKR